MNKKIKYIFIAIFIISAMLSFYLLNKKAEGTTAVIYQNGKIIKKINLNTVSSPYEFDINGEKYTNTVHVEKGRICIIKPTARTTPVYIRGIFQTEFRL